MHSLRSLSSTSNHFRLTLRNSSTGLGLTGLTSASSGLIISTIADNEASATTYTAAGSTIETISTLGTFATPTATKCRFKEVDATNHPGLYEFQFADARFAVSSAKQLDICISGAASLITKAITIQFDPVPSDAYARLGAPAGASISADIAAVKTQTAAIETDTQDIQARLPAALTADGNIKADALRLGGTAQTGRDVGASVLLSHGTGTGQVKLASGYVAITLADVAAQSSSLNLSNTVIAEVSTVSGDVQGAVQGGVVGNIVGNLTGDVGGSVGSVDAAVTITGDAATAATRFLTMITVDGGVYQFTTNALELGPTGGLTAQQVRDAMKLAPTAGAAATDSIDDQLSDITSAIGDISAGSGSGAYAVTVTVTDGANPLENVKARVTDGVTPAFAITDASGNATFSLDAATYGVRLTKAGYQFDPVNRTVTGEESGTLTNDLEMTLVSVPAVAADPAKGTAYGSLVTSDGSSNVGLQVTATLAGPGGPYSIGSTLIPKQHSTVTDSEGQWSLDLYGNADIRPAGTMWRINIGGGADFHKEVLIRSGELTNCDALI